MLFEQQCFLKDQTQVATFPPSQSKGRTACYTGAPPVPNTLVEASLASDAALPVEGTVTMELWSWAGALLHSDHNKTLGVGAFGTTSTAETLRWRLPAIMPAGVSVDECVVLVGFASTDGRHVSNSQIFLTSFAAAVGLVKPNFVAKLLHASPGLPVSSHTSQADSSLATAATFSLTSDAMAAMVAVEMNYTEVPGRFSDNSFMLKPGVPVQLTFTAWGSFAVEDLVKGLRVRSAADGGPTPPDWKAN